MLLNKLAFFAVILFKHLGLAQNSQAFGTFSLCLCACIVMLEPFNPICNKLVLNYGMGIS